VADTEELEEQRRLELLKLLFEFFKHFTTLGAAVGVILLAVYREGVADRLLVATSLVMFGLGVIAAAYGMVFVLFRMRSGNPVGVGPLVLVALVMALICGGLLLFIQELLAVPNWVGVILLVVLLGLIIYGRYGRKRSAR
jgi:hypothetical protein